VNHAGLRLLALCLVIGALGCTVRPRPDATYIYSKGAVAADHPIASEAGAAMLRAGGNAVDAAVATSFCLSVVRPESCGIGGGGFMLIHLRESADGGPLTIALDYRERAPAAVDAAFFEHRPSHASRWGGAAVAIPGTVAGLLHALEHYGTMSREAVLKPAIEAARQGYRIDDHHRKSSDAVHAFLSEHPQHTDLRSAEFLRRRIVEAAAEGRMRLEAQALVLERITADGARGFYDGPVAEAIIRATRASGGVLTHDDLRSVRVKTVTPLSSTFMGRRFLTMPLPSSGGITLVQMLAFLEDHQTALQSSNTLSSVHVIAEAMKHAFADRARYLGDPEYVEVPVEHLLSPAYLSARSLRFDARQTLPQDTYGSARAIPEDGGTSHLAAVDQWGNAVSCTETINLRFGSRVAVPEFGFCLNNQMDDFLSRKGTMNAFGLTQSDSNLPAAGKRPLSSMSPTIVLDSGGHVTLVAGASGGPRIISGTLQVLLNAIVHDLPAGLAVHRPRVHHQWAPHTLFLETALHSDPQMRGGLEALGHHVAVRERIAAVQLIRRSSMGWEAASDWRKGGAPAGH
jgi:gamma-glutamyltranspeptidase/glutathione hydrolase